MPLRIRTRPACRLTRSAASACLFCSFGRGYGRPLLSRASSTAAAAASPVPTAAAAPAVAEAPATQTRPAAVEPQTARSPAQARGDLIDALHALEKQAGVLVNLSRIQLAIRGLQQAPGQETIRVAVLGMSRGQGSSTTTARELLRLILADPLQDEEPWEQQLAGHDPREPLVVRVRGDGSTRPGTIGRDTTRVTIAGGDSSSGGSGALPEIEVASAALRGHRLEFLLMEAPAVGQGNLLAVPTPPAGFEGETETFEETVLVPAVAIPVSAGGAVGGDTTRFTPVTTPVHQAIIVADGLLGAATVTALPLLEHVDAIRAAVELGERQQATDTEPLPFQVIDTATSSKALALFRESVANASAYETLWRQGGVSPLSTWLKEGARDGTGGGTTPTKLPVRRLVSSILRNTLAAVQDAEAKAVAAAASDAGRAASARIAPATAVALDTALANWAEAAHVELQTQLDAAFASRPWRKLGWWKLFWRVDDVTMLSSGLVAQQFLPQAEREVVYLAGQMDEAVRQARGPSETTTHDESLLVRYAAPTVDTKKTEVTAVTIGPWTKWPTHIAFTRRYLLDETVPALQALAQKLVLQTVGTSGLAAALGALTYASATSSMLLGTATAVAATSGGSGGAYEGGAVAALGIVWSLGRLQTKWEAARQFWEGGVREEGRKAVRAVEASVAAALDEAATGGRKPTEEADRNGGDAVLQELRQARALVEKAEEALSRLP